MIYLIVYRLTGSKKISIFSGLIASIDTDLLCYSAEVRPYSIVILFALLSVYVFLKYLENQHKRYLSVLLGLINGALILFHYTASTIIAFQVFYIIEYNLFNKTFDREKVRNISIQVTVAVIMILPMLRHFFYLYENRDILSNYLTDHAKAVNTISLLKPPLFGYIIYPVVVSLISFMLIKGQENVTLNKNSLQKILLIAFWYMIPIVVLIMMELTINVNLLFPRYLVVIIPATIIGSGLIINIYKTSISKFIYLFVLLLSWNCYIYPDSKLS